MERYALPAEDGQEAVNLKRAKQIALDDAGLAADRVTFTKARRGEEDGRFVFEIEFHTDDAEYEYEIDAATGAIRDQSVEPMPRTATGDQNEATPAANAIGLDRAKQIALADAGLLDAKFTREEEDEEDEEESQEGEPHANVNVPILQFPMQGGASGSSNGQSHLLE